MRAFAFAMLGYTCAMLALHVTSWRVFQAWRAGDPSWVGKYLSPVRLLRAEALYWALSLAAWRLWPAAGWRAMVAAFAAIHLSVWMTGEAKPRLVTAERFTRERSRLIAAFDAVEACGLAAMGWLLLRAATGW